MKTQSSPGNASAEPGAPTAAPESTAPGSNDGAAHDEPTGGVFRDAAARAAEIIEYVSYYLAVKADRLKLAAREAVLFAIFALVGLIAVGALIVVAAVLLLVGAANGIGAALGNRLWLGDIIVATVVLVILPIAARAMISRLFGMSRKKTVEKYESRKHEQHARFGHDVGQRARESKQ